MDNADKNYGSYSVAVQGIYRPKTSTYQKLCVYSERDFILYHWYWFMAYTCVMYPIKVNFIITKLSSMIFKSVEVNIYSKVSHMIEKFMNVYMPLSKNTEQGSKVGEKRGNYGKMMGLHVLKFYLILLIRYSSDVWSCRTDLSVGYF